MNFKIKTEQGSTYLELPCREERIAEFCKAVGIPNTSATEVAVEGVYPSDKPFNPTFPKSQPTPRKNSLTLSRNRMERK